MKIIRSKTPRKTGRPFVFSIGRQETAILLATLKMYPLLDPGYHQLSRKPKTTRRADQEWLEEAMDQQRQDHRKKLDRLFKNNPPFFESDKHGLRLSLTGEEMEWMLRVLNEIRVGSWVRLGRPEMEEAYRLNPTGERARFLASMEASGYFEAVLLEAFS